MHFNERVKSAVFGKFGVELKNFDCDGKSYRAGGNNFLSVRGTEFDHRGNKKYYATILNYRDGGSTTTIKSWSSDEETDSFKKEYKKAYKKILAKENKEKEEKLQAFVDYWPRIINNLSVLKEHDYLLSKGFNENPLKKLYEYKSLIVMPAYNIDMEMIGAQFISKEGIKRFAKNSAMSGAFFPFENLEDIFMMKEVVLCEGLATGLSIQKATKKPVVVYFTAGNLYKTAKQFVDKCTIYVAVDNDTQSSTGRKEFQKVNRTLGNRMLMLYPPELGDWNDYHLKYNLDKTAKEIENQIQEHKGHEPHFLGYDGETFYIITADRYLHEINTFSKAKLLTFCDYNYFYKYSKIKEDGSLGAINWDKACNEFAFNCKKKGLVDKSQFKESGVFKTDNDKIIVSSVKSLYDIKGRAINDFQIGEDIFVPAKNYPKPTQINRSSKEDLEKFLDFFKSISWKEEESGLIMASFIPLSMVAGALNWRPHVWIYGSSSSGKSSLMKLIYRKILKDFAITCTKGTTQSGFIRKVTGSSSPVMFDEFESDSSKDSDNIQTCLEFIRLSNSSDFNAYKADLRNQRGVIEYKNYSCFILGSIIQSFKSYADEDRIIPLKLDSTKKNIKEFNRRRKELDYKSITNNLYALALNHLNDINSIYEDKMENDEIQLDGHKKSLWSILSASSELFYGETINTDRFKIYNEERALECLDCILSFIPKDIGITKPIGSVIESYQKGDTTERYNLDSLKIYIDDDKLYIPKRNHYIENKIFKNTKWQNYGWVKALPYNEYNVLFKKYNCNRRCIVIKL